jgi:hypothetical protein
MPRPRRPHVEAGSTAGIFVVLLLAAALTLQLASVEARAAVMGWSSTNLLNLADHPAGALVASAFVGSHGTGLAGWCALAVVGLAATAWRLGVLRTLVVVAGAQVIATYVSQGILVVRLATHHAAADLVSMSDVGPSYVVVAGLTAGVAFGPAWGRLASVAGLIVAAPSLFTNLTALDVTAVGHATSIVTALLIGAAVRSRRPGGRVLCYGVAEPAAR